MIILYRSSSMSKACEQSTLMLCTIERTPFTWEKGRGEKCCPRPESCLPCVRPLLGASGTKGRYMGVTVHRGRVAFTYSNLQQGWQQREVDVPIVSHQSQGDPGIASVWDRRVVASNTYPHNSGTESSHTEAAKRALKLGKQMLPHPGWCKAAYCQKPQTGFLARSCHSLN